MGFFFFFFFVSSASQTILSCLSLVLTAIPHMFSLHPFQASALSPSLCIPHTHILTHSLSLAALSFPPSLFSTMFRLSLCHSIPPFLSFSLFPAIVFVNNVIALSHTIFTLLRPNSTRNFLRSWPAKKLLSKTLLRAGQLTSPPQQMVPCCNRTLIVVRAAAGCRLRKDSASTARARGHSTRARCLTCLRMRKRNSKR